MVEASSFKLSSKRAKANDSTAISIFPWPTKRWNCHIEIYLISMTSRKWLLKRVELRLGVVKSNLIDVPLTLSYSHLFSVISLPPVPCSFHLILSFHSSLPTDRKGWSRAQIRDNAPQKGLFSFAATLENQLCCKNISARLQDTKLYW